MQVEQQMKKYGLPVSLALLLVNLGFLVWYLFVGYQAAFHSDSAAKVLLAREIVETGKYFPPHWNYVNGDLFVLFGHTFIIPLLAFMPAGYTAHAISGLISSALILSGVWFLTGLAPLSRVRRVLIVAVMAAGISGFAAENLYGQVSYGVFVYFACYMVFFSWQCIRAEQTGKWPWAAALLIAVVLVFWMNPQRALILFGLPLLAATVILRLELRDIISRAQSKGIWLQLLMVFTGIAIGGYLHMRTLSGVNNVMGAGYARWLSYDSMLRNISLTPMGLLAIFGGAPSVDGAVISRTGLYEAVRLIAALVLLGLMPVAAVRSLRQREPGLFFLGVFSLVALLGVLFLQMTTTVPDMRDPVTSSRYLVPSLIFLLILVLMQPIDWIRSPVFGFSVIAVLMVFLTSAYPTFVRTDRCYKYSWGRARDNTYPHKGLVDFLVSNNLRYGYGTYWNAGNISVLSNEKVLVRGIVINKGVPMPFRWLSSDRWYAPSSWRGDTFLLLTQEEAKEIDWNRLSLKQVRPVRELKFDAYTIYIFSGNIAEHLPGWGRK